MSSRRPWLIIAAATTVSCQLVYGLDDFKTGDAGTSSSGTGASGGTGGGSIGGGGPVGGAPSCTVDGGVACVGTALDAYAGFYHVVESDPAHPPTACSSQATPKHFFEQPPDASCTACTCDPPTEPQCSIPTLTGYTFDGCVPPKFQLSDGMGCDAALGASVKYQAPAPSGCAPRGGDLATPTWGHEVTLCEIATGTEGCAADEVCAPADQPLCIVAPGEVADCPAGWGKPRVVWADRMEGRGCSPCACKAEWGCPGVYRIFDGSACSGNETDLAPGDCQNATDVQYDDRPPSGTIGCTVSGGDPNGGVFQPLDPSTICCRPP